MVKECGDAGGIITIWYKLPGTNMERGLFDLVNDDEVMTMCNLMPSCKYFELYVVVTPPLSQETAKGDSTIGEGDPHLTGIEIENMEAYEDPAVQIPVELNHGNESQAESRSRRKGSVLSFDFEWPDSTQCEMEMEEEIRAEEGVYKDFSDFEDEEEGEVHKNDDSSSVSSFYSDESNKDESDDDLVFERNVDEDVEDILDEDSGEDRQVNLDDDCDTDESSVYANSDDERMCGNSTDDETNINKYPAFNEDVDMANPIFELGLCFKSSGLFRKAVKKHAIMERRPISNVRNYGKKIKYVCEAPCQWKIYAAPIKDTTTYQVRIFNRNHTCMPTFKQKQINSTWIAEHYLNEIRMNPSWPVPNFHKKIVNDLKCDVSRHAVYRAKRKALLKINGTHQIQFEEVWNYGNELQRVMPDTTVKILTEEPDAGTDRGRFLRIYVCLGPLKKAFAYHCRHIVGLDGCHLKGPFGGQLLAAVGIDANEGMYPVAWAVVEAETTESWKWFLQLLCPDIQVISDVQWTFISDRQKV